MLLVGALGACGGGPDLVPSAANGLPREESSLQDLCPGRSDLRGSEARRLRARASRELRALLAAHRRDPGASIRIAYTAAEDADPHTEVIGLDEVIRGNLDVLRRAHCDPAAQQRLSDALSGR